MDLGLGVEDETMETPSRATSEVCQGDVFWISPEALRPSVPGVAHPHVVIQSDVLNWSRIPTTVVCGISSNLRMSSEAGNVILDDGEANLPSGCPDVET